VSGWRAPLAGVLTPDQIDATVRSIATCQLPDGMIPWFAGGHADAWNHTEAAMALVVGGRVPEAEAAYRWLARHQLDDGSWFMYYTAGARGIAVEDYRRDTNVSAYVATGLWFHTLTTGDDALLSELWPMVERAMEFALSLQWEGGELCWSREPDGSLGRFALLTGSSSAYFSLRCAVAAAEHLGEERPEWELAAGRLAHAIAHRLDAFADKDSWAMDWYYPALCGAVRGAAARERLSARWDEFVMPGLGVRCVSESDWVTAAETAECALALDAVGMRHQATALMRWGQHLRELDGSYWTGCVYPQSVHFPAGEHTTYTAAAMVLAANALNGWGGASGLFRDQGLPAGLDLEEDLSETIVET